MPETSTWRNSRDKIHRQASSTTTSWIELETISMCACASPQWDKSSEIGSESSQPSSTNARLIGSCPGPKRLWYPWLNPSLRSSKNSTLLTKQRFNWWGTWVMSIWWSLISVEPIIPEWEDKCTSLLNLTSIIFLPTRNSISKSIGNLISNNPTSPSVSTRSMKLLMPSTRWRSS